MKLIADLHIHSKHARACSSALSIDNLEKYAKIKGINLLGTGDFQHPLHRQEINEKLTEDDKGVLRTSSGFPFIWQTEISLMYSQPKRRAVHHVVLCPNKQTADKITDYLASKGRLDYDGRPIFGIPSPQLVKDLKAISDQIEIIPAHCLLPNEKVICNTKPKLISKIKIGENVLTHTGTYKKVTKTYVRQYKGKVYRIQPYYFREGINVTDEHPFLAIKTKKNCSFVGGLCKPNSTAKGKHKCTKKHYEDYKPEWIPTKNLKANDVLLYPRIKEIVDKPQIKISDIIGNKNLRILDDYIVPNSGRQNKQIKNTIKVTPDFCRLVGYYLAEGYIVKKNNCVQFAFAAHENDFIQDVISLMKEYFGINLNKKRKRHGYEIYFYSKVLVELFEKLFYDAKKPKKAFSKKLPDWMMRLPKDEQAELFRGWWRGDTGVTSSEILATQMKLICLRLGIIPSIYKKTKEEHDKRGPKHKERLIKANSDCYFLQNLSFYEDLFGLLNDAVFTRFKTKLLKKHGWLDENYAYIPIKRIEERNYTGEVYNLEVEEDNSYVTTAATVHNCMTPWFGLFGSKSGFDSLQECFQDQTHHIHAIESGMSADPPMLWRFKEKVNIVSFSDAHSFWPWRIGRESTIFDIPEVAHVSGANQCNKTPLQETGVQFAQPGDRLRGLTYENIIKSIRTGVGLKATIETPPSYGRYHWDGHRKCNFSCPPDETKHLKGICPKCSQPLIIGVDYRVEEISKEAQNFQPQDSKPYYDLLPLHELIALYHSTSLNTKKAWAVYNELIDKFQNEFNILLNITKEEFQKAELPEQFIEIILLNRQNKLKIQPGYDGEYGVVQLPRQQATLF